MLLFLLVTSSTFSQETEGATDNSTDSPTSTTEESTSDFVAVPELAPLSPLQELLLNDVGYSFIEAFATIRQLYLEDVDDDVILQGAIEGMITALDDPYSYYMEPATAELENETRTGSYSGIGVNLATKSRQEATTIEITRINALGPSKRAGLRRGDIFKKIDNIDVTEMNLDELVRLLRGDEGTAVVLTMYRPSLDEELEFVIVREIIDIVSIESTVLPDNVGYINLLSFFNAQVAEKFTEKYNELLEQDIEALIIDLRDNGGGYLWQAKDIADLFLEEGTIYWERTSTSLTASDATKEDTDNTTMPIVLLVNGQTASSAEIFAAALDENDRVYIIGEQTFGKGVASEYYEFKNRGAIQLTIEEWLSPDQNSVSEVGLEPDLLVTDSRYPQVLEISGTGGTPGQILKLTKEDGSIAEIKVDEDGFFNFSESVNYLDNLPEEVTGDAYVDLVGDAILTEAILYLKSLE